MSTRTLQECSSKTELPSNDPWLDELDHMQLAARLYSEQYVFSVAASYETALCPWRYDIRDMIVNPGCY